VDYYTIKNTAKNGLKSRLLAVLYWWTLTDLNRWPFARQANALPAELNVHIFVCIPKPEREQLYIKKIKMSRIKSKKKQKYFGILNIKYWVNFIPYIIDIWYNCFDFS
jgi:hypothetical protein